MAPAVHRAQACVISDDDFKHDPAESAPAAVPLAPWPDRPATAPSTVPSLVPTLLGPWTFCLPARPAPYAAGDPAWLVFLGVPPAPDVAARDPWIELLTR